MQILDISHTSNEALETEHDWVQRAFPTPRASAVTGRTWQLTDDDVRELRQDPQLQEMMQRNVVRFLAFMKSDPRAITREFNHNYQRVTRVLESLRSLGFPVLAQQFHASLVKAFTERGMALPDADRCYWQPALKGTPSLAAVLPRTGLPPCAEVPEIIGIGPEALAGSVARALGGQAMPGEVGTLDMASSAAVIPPVDTGGHLEAAWVDRYGAQLQERVQTRIHELYGADCMPPGEAFMIRSYPDGVPVPAGRAGWLIVAPLQGSPAAGTPQVSPDVAGRALEAALIVAGEAGMSRVYLSDMGAGSTSGSRDLSTEVLRAFAEACDQADMYLYDRFSR